MANVSYERRGAAAVLTIERPERRNAVDAATAEELHEGFMRFEEDDEARVMILTGAGALPYLRDGPVASTEDFRAVQTAFGDDWLGYAFWFN